MGQTFELPAWPATLCICFAWIQRATPDVRVVEKLMVRILAVFVHLRSINRFADELRWLIALHISRLRAPRRVITT